MPNVAEDVSWGRREVTGAVDVKGIDVEVAVRFFVDMAAGVEEGPGKDGTKETRGFYV